LLCAASSRRIARAQSSAPRSSRRLCDISCWFSIVRTSTNWRQNRPLTISVAIAATNRAISSAAPRDLTGP
jgi:hypothetical protein